MAAAAKKITEAPASEPETPAFEAPVLTVGKFTFKLSFGVEPALPTSAARAPSSKALPFKRLFDNMVAGIEATKSPDKPAYGEFFLPNTFWTGAAEEGGRGMDAKLVEKVGYIKQKVRDQFNVWRKEDEAARSKYVLLVAVRKAGDLDANSEPFAEDGATIYLTEPKAG
jgi:hypothetical protein